MDPIWWRKGGHQKRYGGQGEKNQTGDRHNLNRGGETYEAVVNTPFDKLQGNKRAVMAKVKQRPWNFTRKKGIGEREPLVCWEIKRATRKWTEVTRARRASKGKEGMERRKLQTSVERRKIVHLPQVHMIRHSSNTFGEGKGTIDKVGSSATKEGKAKRSQKPQGKLKGMKKRQAAQKSFPEGRSTRRKQRRKEASRQGSGTQGTLLKKEK